MRISPAAVQIRMAERKIPRHMNRILQTGTAVPRLWLFALVVWLVVGAIATVNLWHLRQNAMEAQSREIELLSLALIDEVERGLRGVEDGLNALQHELHAGHTAPRRISDQTNADEFGKADATGTIGLVDQSEWRGTVEIGRRRLHPICNPLPLSCKRPTEIRRPSAGHSSVQWATNRRSPSQFVLTTSQATPPVGSRQASRLRHCWEPFRRLLQSPVRAWRYSGTTAFFSPARSSTYHH